MEEQEVLDRDHDGDDQSAAHHQGHQNRPARRVHGLAEGDAFHQAQVQREIDGRDGEAESDKEQGVGRPPIPCEEAEHDEVRDEDDRGPQQRMHAAHESAEGAAGDREEDPGALVVAAMGEDGANEEEQRAEGVRQEVHGRETAREGVGAKAADQRQRGRDRERDHGDHLAAELPVAKHHAADKFEAGAGGLPSGPASRQAGDGGSQRGTAGAARGSMRGTVHDGGNADQVVAGERAEAEDDAQQGDHAEGDPDGPESGGMPGQSKRYVQRLEDALGTAEQKEEEQGCGFGDLPGGFDARGGDEANQPAEEGAAGQRDHQAEYAGGEEVEQRVAPACSGQEESGQGGKQVERGYEVAKHAQEVREFGRGVSGAVDGLVRQNHAFHRVDEAVGGFRKQGHEEKKGAEAEKGGEVGAYPYSEQDLNPGQHRREQGVYDGNHFEADAVASQVAEHFAAIGEFAEQVDQQPVAMGVDAEAAQHAGDGGAAQVALECLQDGVHQRSAWMMRETPVSRPAEPVRLRKTSSSVDSWVDALSVSAEPSAINAPLWMMRTRLQMRSTTSRTWEL